MIYHESKCLATMLFQHADMRSATLFFVLANNYGFARWEGENGREVMEGNDRRIVRHHKPREPPDKLRLVVQIYSLFQSRT